MNNSLSTIQYGRGQGSFRVKDSSAYTPIRSSVWQVKKNINFDPKQFLVAECSERDVEIFKQVFDFLDDDHDGMLTPMDLRKAIRDYGEYSVDKPFVYVAMSVFDMDSGGQITFKQFVKLMTQHPCESDTVEDIERVFELFDEDNKGYISVQDLKMAADELGEKVSTGELEEVIHFCNPTGEGVITREAFVTYNKRKNFA